MFKPTLYIMSTLIDPHKASPCEKGKKLPKMKKKYEQFLIFFFKWAAPNLKDLS